MLSIKNMGFIIVTLMALLGSASVFAGGKSYLMVCQGGGGMKMGMDGRKINITTQ